MGDPLDAIFGALSSSMFKTASESTEVRPKQAGNMSMTSEQRFQAAKQLIGRVFQLPDSHDGTTSKFIRLDDLIGLGGEGPTYVYDFGRILVPLTTF
jgi:hypothetical protein